MRARWLVAAVVLLLLLGTTGAATAIFANRRHLTVSDLLHGKTHHGPGIYPDAVRDNYTQACKATSGDTSLCGCVYNKMAERYTLKEFESISGVLPLGLPDEVRQMVADCGANITGISFQPVRAIDCNEAVDHPTELVLACADAGVSLQGLLWSSWGGASAVGRGKLEQNDCDPDCADGSFHAYPVTVHLTDIEDGSAGPVYTRVRVEYDGEGPSGQPSEVFDLPAEPGP